MARPYTEQQVLKKLDIPDFRHLTKEKVIAFATMVPKMNPEVAKKALEQFPNFASTSLDVLKEYRSVIQEAMEDDRESMRSCYDMYNRVMDSLEKMLDNDDLTFEQKTYILDQMQEVAAAVQYLAGFVLIQNGTADGVDEAIAGAGNAVVEQQPALAGLNGGSTAADLHALPPVGALAHHMAVTTPELHIRALAQEDVTKGVWPLSDGRLSRVYRPLILRGNSTALRLKGIKGFSMRTKVLKSVVLAMPMDAP